MRAGIVTLCNKLGDTAASKPMRAGAMQAVATAQLMRGGELAEACRFLVWLIVVLPAVAVAAVVLHLALFLYFST